MNQNLRAVKNLFWLIGIGLSLLAMFVALILASVTKYDGPIERGGPVLGAKKPAPAVADSAETGGGSGELLRLEKTDDGGSAYLDGLTLLVDSTLVGLRDYHVLEEQSSAAQIWASSDGNFPAGDLAANQIRYSDGSMLTASQAAMVARPARLVICVGSDGVGDMSQEDFIRSYTGLIRSIRETSPDTVIICCSVSSVTTGYSGVSGLTPGALKEANSWIRQVCVDTGAYFADTATAVNDSANWLMPDYATVNGKTLNSEGLNAFLSYLRTHMVP